MTVPGPPVRTSRNHGSAQARSAGGLAPTTSAPVKRKGGGFSTPGLLSVLRILLILTILGTTLAGVLSLTARSEDLNNIELQAARVLRLESIKTEILRADGLATNGLAQGAAEPAEQRDEYREHLNQAAVLTVEAGRDGAVEGNDLSLELGRANAALVTYATTIELARVLMPTDPTRANQLIDEADQALNNDAIQALDRVIQANRDLLEEARAISSAGIGAVAAIPIVLLILVSIAVARRTRRILNIGLLLALLAAVGSYSVQSHSVQSTNTLIDDTKSSQLQEALASSRAFSHLSAAKSVEGHQLVQIDRVTPLNEVWTTHFNQVEEELTNLRGSGTYLPVVGSYKRAHDAIVTVVQTGDKAAIAAAAGSDANDGVNATYNRALAGLQGVARDKRSELSSIMLAQSQRLNTFAAMVAAFGLFGALSVGFGLAARIKEYR